MNTPDQDKKWKLRWFGHVLRSSGLAKMKRKKKKKKEIGKQNKRWKDNSGQVWASPAQLEQLITS